MNDDVNIVWRGPFASLPRPMDDGMVREVATTAAIFAGLAAFALVPFLIGWLDLPGANRVGVTVVFVLAAAAALAQFALRSASEARIALLHPTISVSIFLLGNALIAAAVVFGGQGHTSVAVFYVEFMLLAFVLLRLRWAIAVTAFYLAGYALALALVEDPIVPVQQFISVLASAAAAGALVGRMTSRLDIARHDLADLNRNLEARVADQVRELERAGRLRRFLSPQVADVVVSSDTAGLLAPHRREVSVLFVDLRGFTAFTNEVEPDVVMRVLDEYYRTVGDVLDVHAATIGGFDGDGVMAYLGDPVPIDDPARAGVVVAQEIAERLDALVAEWSRADVRLGYGVGLAFGVATLGVVGSRGRSDYTPVGAVVNLAARLCADAQPGEIVVDATMLHAAGTPAATAREAVDLKGFGSVPTFALAR